MNVVVLAVHFHELRRKIKADLRKDGPQSFDRISVQDLIANLCDEDQMNIKLKDAMFTVSNVT
jgi:hypothetical protein